MTTALRILVVDDDPEITDAVRRHFERRGADVAVADGADAAIATHRRAPADVAIIDLALGRTNGLTVLREFQRDATPPECLIITGHGTIDTAVEAMRVGAFDYIEKPFVFDDLDARVALAASLRAARVSAKKSAPPPLDEVERRHIAAVLERVGWHQGRAAEILRISPKTLYRKIRAYGFKRPRRGDGGAAL